MIWRKCDHSWIDSCAQPLNRPISMRMCIKRAMWYYGTIALYGIVWLVFFA